MITLSVFCSQLALTSARRAILATAETTQATCASVQREASVGCTCANAKRLGGQQSREGRAANVPNSLFCFNRFFLSDRLDSNLMPQLCVLIECINPCDSDPCFSADNPGNICLQPPGSCGEYTCQCGSPGWTTPFQGLTCQRCNDPCEGNRCRGNEDSRNRCVPVYSNAIGYTSGTPGATVQCGTHVCQCAGSGFLPSVDSRTCTRCDDTCAAGDPCFTRNNDGNKCLPARGGICGLYTCQCNEPGWLTPIKAKTCQGRRLLFFVFAWFCLFSFFFSAFSWFWILVHLMKQLLHGGVQNAWTHARWEILASQMRTPAMCACACPTNAASTSASARPRAG